MPTPSVAVYLATSLDGFIARPDGSLDWLPAIPETGEDYGYAAFMGRIDAIVMGRNTFDIVRTFDEWPYAGKRLIVLTSRPLRVPEKLADLVEVRGGEPADLMRQLAAEGVRRVYLDGGLTIQRFLRSGLVDELTITRLPVLLGAGIPLFGPLTHDVLLTHVTTTAYANGMVQSTYRTGRAAR